MENLTKAEMNKYRLMEALLKGSNISQIVWNLRKEQINYLFLT